MLLVSSCDNVENREYPTTEDGHIALIPWGIGGATSQAFEAIRDQLEQRHGYDFTPVYMPGDGGFDGAQYAWEHRYETNILLFGALKTIMSGYRMQGKWDKGAESYRVYSIWKTSEPVLAVSTQSNIKTAQQAIEKLRATASTIATAGEYSGGDVGSRALAKLLLSQYTPVHRKGGAQAIDAALFGEAEFVIAFYSEMQEPISEGLLKPILAISNNPLIYDEIVIEPLGDYIDVPVPEMGTTFGYVIPADAPKEVTDRFDGAHNVINVLEVAIKKGVLPRIIYGELAMQELQKEIETDEWAFDFQN